MFSKSCRLPIDFKKNLDIGLFELYYDFIKMIRNRKNLFLQTTRISFILLSKIRLKHRFLIDLEYVRAFRD